MTVSDLQSRMTNAELMGWVAYVDENGPLNPILRIESAIARAVAPFMRGVKPRDLMVWPKEPEPEASPEALASLFKSLASKTNHRKK